MKGFITDVTNRLMPHQALEKRVASRTRELATLLEVSRIVASTLELEPLLGLILDQLKSVMDYSGAAIFQLEDEELAVRAYRGPISQEEMLRFSLRLNDARAHREVVLGRHPVIIHDITGNHPLAEAFRESVGSQLSTIFGYVHSWMGVPLIARERTLGMLTLYHTKPNHFSPRKAQLALAFANEASIAVDNARLYREEQKRRMEAEQRRRVAEGLRDILETINSNRPLNDILDHVVSQAGSLLGADQVVLYRRQSKEEALAVHASRGLLADPTEAPGFPLGPRASGRGALTRHPAVISDLLSALPNSEEQCISPPYLSGVCRALLSVPIIIQKEVYGGLELYYAEPRGFSQEEVRLALALADQAALAIDNARLRAQTEQAAVVAERNRLARDLHDAVTQTLFSATLIAEVLPKLWTKKPEEVLPSLEELRQLTRGALAEMRTLLLELHPTALTEVGLGDLLRQLAEAITGRARLPVTLKVDGEGTLPPDVQVALYRIAQEALNNVIKHAGAKHVSMELRFHPRGVELTVTDDGCGFEPKGVSAEHLGLRIMEERAESVDVALKVESQVGGGTRIVVCWNSREEQGGQ